MEGAKKKKENIESTNSIQIDSFAEEKSHPANCRKIAPTSLDPMLLSLSLSNPLLSTPSSEPFNQTRYRPHRRRIRHYAATC